MYLKRLDVQGFKSLADKIELQFNPGISAIVGPNGCGKSNIADAVRWVLGEQSAKTLRGAKMEDVIFSGSDRRKQVGMAEVSITLDNSTGMFPLDFLEITITRRVYRSGESEYLINKSACRLRDIHELFMDTGIGREGYSIIGQGKIDEILSVKAEDRRLIIEETAGIVKYKSRKQQAVKKLNDTEQNLVRIHDIINELETQVGPLEEQSQTAHEFLGLKKELDYLEVNLLVNQIHDQKEKLREINSSSDEKNRELLESETLLRIMDSEVEEQKLIINKFDEEIAGLQKSVYETGSLAEKKEAEIMVAVERQRSQELQRSDHTKEILELRKKEVREKSVHVGDERSLEELREKIRISQRSLGEQEALLLQLDMNLQQDQKAIEEYKGDIIDQLNAMAGFNNSVNTGETELNNLQRRITQLDNQKDNIGSETRAVLLKGEELENRNADILEQIGALSIDEERVTGNKAELNDQLEKLHHDLNLIREMLQDKASRLKALEDLQRDYEGYYRGVKEVLQEGKKDNQCSGICGVIAELIKVPEEYEIALEVALGGALQFIVTETDNDARVAIEFLKRNKLGRATFLPMNAIKPLNDKLNLKLRGNSGYRGLASEIVKHEDKYFNIIEYLLGKVLIVEDIKNATEIARTSRGLSKIVTLDGDVVNPGGSLTGGIYHKANSNLLGRAREIEQTAIEKDRLNLEVVTLEKSILMAQADLDRSLQQITEIKGELQKLLIDQSASQKDLEVVSREMERLDSTRNLVENEKHNLLDEIKNIEAHIIKQREHLEELQLKDKYTRGQIDELKAVLAGAEERKAVLSEEVTKTRVELATLSQEELNKAHIMGRVFETIREIQVQIQRKENQIREFDQKREVLESEIRSYTEEIGRLMQHKDAFQETLQTRRNEKQFSVAILTQKENSIKSMTKSIALIKEYCHAAEIRRTRLEFELDNGQSRLAEDFQTTYEVAISNKTEITFKKEVTSRIRVLKESIGAMGNVNLGAIKDFGRVKERYDFLSKQFHDMEQAKESLYRVIAEMDQIMIKRFSKAFTEINTNFSEVFARLFGGGKAELILTDSDNLLETGIEILARPPGKKNQHLSLLSGGEKALTAIALLFSILKTKPSPFCILDEIEANLDEANVDRFAGYLKEFALNTQFILITHRKGTMEVADVLYGVTMDEFSVSKLVSMKFSEEVSKVS